VNIFSVSRCINGTDNGQGGSQMWIVDVDKVLVG